MSLNQWETTSSRRTSLFFLQLNVCWICLPLHWLLAGASVSYGHILLFIFSLKVLLTYTNKGHLCPMDTFIIIFFSIEDLLAHTNRGICVLWIHSFIFFIRRSTYRGYITKDQSGWFYKIFRCSCFKEEARELPNENLRLHNDVNWC